MTRLSLSADEEVAAVAAAVQLLLATRQHAIAPTQDPTAWRFQNRWWIKGPLGTRPRP